MFKNLVVSLFLKTELAALKSRLEEATAALDKIEKEAVSIAKEASAEVQALGEKVLGIVLSSADKVRAKEAPFIHEWEQKLYEAYAAAKNVAESTFAKAEALVKKTAIFFKEKL